MTWYDVALIILAVLVVAYGIAAGKAKEWLKYAVCVAEEELGSGTGQLKLHMVYDMFVEKFPALASVLPFNIFSKWVDLALEWMREQLEKNEMIKLKIEG
ncbi:MAG: hypothetical protein IIY21_19340 [Clostridiales bacterium]|nr:hypothetical protein [Clostridiales bacterium]